jgi:hypothetical protein
MDDSRDIRNPGGLFPERQDFKDYARLEHGRYRRDDPERQREIRQAIERLANSPEEAEEATQAWQHIRDRGIDFRPDHVPSLFTAMRSGTDPVQAVEEANERRADRHRPVPSVESEQSEYQYVETPRRRPERPPFVGREERVEDAIVSADLPPEQESTLRRVLRILADQGPPSPSLVRSLAQSLRNGVGQATLLSKHGVNIT